MIDLLVTTRKDFPRWIVLPRMENLMNQEIARNAEIIVYIEPDQEYFRILKHKWSGYDPDTYYSISTLANHIKSWL